MVLGVILFVCISLTGLAEGFEREHPTNCLIVLDSGAIASDQKASVVRSMIEKQGGSVRHVFWPSALFAYMREGSEASGVDPKSWTVLTPGYSGRNLFFRLLA